jgi:glycosyltransferase involved in cell wall biosynthesis
MLGITLVIPAYNEALTIGKVVKVALETGLFQRVIVVNDGSDKDRTSDIAKESGAFVIDLWPNNGKGEAMKRALQCVETPVVMFWDADLLNVTDKHFQMLIDEMLAGYDVVVGVLPDLSQRVVSYCSGQRIISTANARRFFEDRPLVKGFGVDGAMIDWAKKNSLKVKIVVLQEIRHIRKVEKRGLIMGIVGYVRMWWQVCRGK